MNLFQRAGYRALRASITEHETLALSKLLGVDPEKGSEVARLQVRASHAGQLLTRIQEEAESLVLEHSKTFKSLEGKPIYAPGCRELVQRQNGPL